MIFNKLGRFNNTLTLMIIQFNKYPAAGNDFRVIDNRDDRFNPCDFKIILRGSYVIDSANASVISGHFDTNPVIKEEEVGCHAGYRSIEAGSKIKN
jgi:hypothetical protein